MRDSRAVGRTGKGSIGVWEICRRSDVYYNRVGFHRGQHKDDTMTVDIETELVQMWAGSREVEKMLRGKLLAEQGNLSISSMGLRPGRDHQIAGLMQILRLSQSYTLEIAIKALYRTLNPNSNPRHDHDLWALFQSLNKGVKNRINSKWSKAEGRSPMVQDLTFEEFLGEHRLTFEESRYLYEDSKSYQLNTRDFDIAIGLTALELADKSTDSTFYRNLFNVLSEGQGEQ